MYKLFGPKVTSKFGKKIVDFSQNIIMSSNSKQHTSASRMGRKLKYLLTGQEKTPSLIVVNSGNRVMTVQIDQVEHGEQFSHLPNSQTDGSNFEKISQGRDKRPSWIVY